jgi:hypothetical protein
VRRAIFAAFVLTQVLDGVLTYAGVSRGVAGEANPLIGVLISVWGLSFALLIVKTAAVMLGALIHKHRQDGVLFGLTMFYWVMAIHPWMHLLRAE